MAYTYELISEGPHECVISSAGLATTQRGTEYIKLNLAVRNDIESPNKNRVIFDNLWLSEKARQYSERKMGAILSANDFTEGRKFETDNDWCGAVLGLPIIAVVKHKYDDYRGENVAYVSYYKRTEQPDVKHAWKNGAPVPALNGMPAGIPTGIPAGIPAGFTAVTIDEDDLPF